METQVYPVPLFPGLYDGKVFGVEQESEEFLPLTSKSVALPPYPSPPRLDFGLFQQEPAITELD